MRPSTTPASMTEILHERRAGRRIELLRQVRRAPGGLPRTLVRDLLFLDLSDKEKIAYLRAVADEPRAEYERFLIDLLAEGPLELSHEVVRLWIKRTDHAAADRLLGVLAARTLDQRLCQALLDANWHAAGRELLEMMVDNPAIADMTPRTHALLLWRSVQWQVDRPALRRLAEAYAREGFESSAPETPAMLPALAFLARFDPHWLVSAAEMPFSAGIWGDLHATLRELQSGRSAALTEISAWAARSAGHGADFHTGLHRVWPPLWTRHLMPADLVRHVVTLVARRPLPQDLSPPPAAPITWEFFAGLDPATLAEALTSLGDGEAFHRLYGMTCFFLSPVAKRAFDDRLRSSRRPTGRDDSAPSPPRAPVRPADEVDPDAEARGRFFDLVYRLRPVTPPVGRGVWDILAAAHLDPRGANLDRVLDAGRSLGGPFVQCFYDVAGRFQGRNEILPSLESAVRATDEVAEMSALARALSDIGTPDATLLLMRLLERVEVPTTLKIEICQFLRERDLSRMQGAVRSMLVEHTRSLKVRASGPDLIEALESLLMTDSGLGKPPQGADAMDDHALDTEIRRLVPAVGQLPSDVRRCFRTALFLMHTLESQGADANLDLSSPLDMQYKGLELLFRSRFEQAMLETLKRGGIQGRLTSLGYPRGGDAATRFENDIAALPLVRDIPAFSRFKLSKLMQSIASFRPGRRFVLDGLKAHALFFLAFSRRRCPHGLARLFPLALDRDEDLYRISADLHIFQDIRNRAVHQGMNARDLGDLRELWVLTNSLVEAALRMLVGRQN